MLENIQEVFCYLHPVSLKSSVTDSLEEYVVNCISQTPILFDSLSEGGGCFERNKKLNSKPPSRTTFLKGVERVHYQFILWKSAPDINPDKPMPDNYVWKRNCDKYISAT